MTQKRNDFPEVISSIRNIIKTNDRFLILTHEKPDGDAIGSQLALAIALQKMGKSVEAVSDEAPEQYRALPKFGILKPIEKYEPDRTPDICFVLDSSNLERVPKGIVPNETEIINIDHHADNSNFGKLNYVDSNSAATGILIYRLLTALEYKIDKDTASNLYAAVITDTGRFSFTNTNTEVFEVTADLIRCGASPAEMTNMLYKNYSFRRAVIFGKALQSIESHIDGRVVTMELSNDTIRGMDIKPSETDGLVEYLQGIKEQEAAFLLKEFSPGEVRVSLRSRGRINVMKIAEKYNGGGHLAASGCTMYMKLDEAKKMLVEECRLQLD